MSIKSDDGECVVCQVFKREGVWCEPLHRYAAAAPEYLCESTGVGLR